MELPPGVLIGVLRKGVERSRGNWKEQRLFVAARRNAEEESVRSKLYFWRPAQVARLEALLAETHNLLSLDDLSIVTSSMLDDVVARAKQLLIGSASSCENDSMPSSRANASPPSIHSMDGVDWHGTLDKEVLLRQGYIVKHAVVRRSDACAIHQAARASFEPEQVEQLTPHSSRAQLAAAIASLEGAKVHYDVPDVGSFGMRTLDPRTLETLDAAALSSWERARQGACSLCFLSRDMPLLPPTAVICLSCHQQP